MGSLMGGWNTDSPGVTPLAFRNYPETEPLMRSGSGAWRPMQHAAIATSQPPLLRRVSLPAPDRIALPAALHSLSRTTSDVKEAAGLPASLSSSNWWHRLSSGRLNEVAQEVDDGHVDVVIHLGGNAGTTAYRVPPHLFDMLQADAAAKVKAALFEAEEAETAARLKEVAAAMDATDALNFLK